MNRFSVKELILISAMAALGLAVKPVVTPLAHIISTSLMIPGGALAGGLYMMWLVVAFGLTGKRGTAILTGLVQGIAVMLTGMPGSHGVMSIFSYTMPGLVMDLGMLLLRRRIEGSGTALTACVLANVTGTLCVNVIFYNLPLIPLLLSVSAASLSGAVGGLLAWQLLRALDKYGIGENL